MSNVPSGGDELADQLGLTDNIDFAVTSSEVGFEKPDPKDLRRSAAQGKFDTLPMNAVMVGDQIETDVNGALSCGHSTGVARQGLDDTFEFAAHPRIASLEQLNALLC